MKKMDVFDALDKIEAKLTRLIDVKKCRIEFSKDNKLSNDCALTIFYSYKNKDSNFTIHQFNIDNAKLELLISGAKSQIAKITRNQPISFTLTT